MEGGKKGMRERWRECGNERDGGEKGKEREGEGVNEREGMERERELFSHAVGRGYVYVQSEYRKVNS